jgi:tetratricopeptide (TPR) repeat protein
MMKAKLKSFLFTVVATTALMGQSAIAQAKSPRSCYDGFVYLSSKKYKKSISKLSACLRSSALTKERRAVAYFNRAEAYLEMYYDLLQEGEFKEADKMILNAFEDIEKSIGLDPVGIPAAYCLRGWIYLEESWGTVGDEDLEKGIAMGAPKYLCEPQQ